MADHYVQFSEMISDIPDEGLNWAQMILTLDWEDEEDGKKLLEELNLANDADLDGWPNFSCELRPRDNELWLHSDEGFSEDHLCWFVQRLLAKFMPDYLFTVTLAHTCSKPRIGEFGGSFIVIFKEHVIGDNTWDAAKQMEERLIAGDFDE